jgi:hypothetical protein
VASRTGVLCGKVFCGKVFEFLSLLLHDQLLAGDAIPAPRYRGQSIHADVLAAMQAFAKGAVIDPANCGFHQLQQPAFLRLLPERHFL